MDPVPPPHRPAPRCATATPPRTGRPPPPRPAVPAQKQTGLAEKGWGFRARCRPPRRRSPCRGRSSTLVAASGETATVGAAPHARRPPPAPSLRLRCQRRGPPARRTNDTPAAASGKKDSPTRHRPHLGLPPHHRCLCSEGSSLCPSHPASRTDSAPASIHPAERTPPVAASISRATGNTPASVLHPIRLRPEGRTPLRHPTGTKPSGRADSGERHPAPGQRPAPASCLKEERLPRCGLRLEASTPQASSPKDRRHPAMQPPDRRGERADTHPAQIKGIPRLHPGQSRLIDEDIPLARSASGVSFRTQSHHRQHCALRLERLPLR